MKFFTIGYGGRKPDDLVGLLSDAGVRTVADVRLRPDRSSMGAYAKARTADKGIEHLLSSHGIGYRSLPELGNIFLDFADWEERYATFIYRAGDLLVTRLEELEKPVCLLCAERRVADCHRLLIAQFLVSRGYEVEHLDTV